MILDIRSKLLLIICANYLVFTMPSNDAEGLFIALIIVVTLLAGKYSTAIKMTAITAVLMLLNRYYPVSWTGPISVLLRIMATYFKQLTSVFFACTYFAKTSTIRELMLALRKMKVPQFVIIPLVITVRYFPSLAQDYRMTSDAIKLRGTRGSFSKIKALYVTLLTSALMVSDEIMAAAISRGIENPCKKKCTSIIVFKAYDYIFMALLTMVMGLHIGGVV